jgi:DNA sulfur modification protein DndC
MDLAEAIRLTVNSLCEYAKRYSHWAVAYSGGKDSTAVLTILHHLIEEGAVPRPKTLTVLYADTRMELPPLHLGAMALLDTLRSEGIDCRVVLPELDDRFMVYMLGRGIPPPNNKTFRWCTSQIKIEPMQRSLKALRDRIGEKILMLTGVRLGESAARDERIITSCSRDNTECGQGWLQIHTPEAICDTLAPLVHWRVCHVWAWLTAHAPIHGFNTRLLATVYGGEEAEEIHARTGCIQCPLASRDTALDNLLKKPEFAHLAPLKRLRPLYEELRFTRRFRLRKPGTEILKDGSIGRNPQRLGPLTMEARQYGLSKVLDIQKDAGVSLINEEELDRIYVLIAAGTWPEKWTGDEPLGDELLDKVFQDGSIQPLLVMPT